MNGRYVMALDAGTTSVRAIIFNENSEIISIARREITQVYPVSGWVEHDPMEIWSSVPAVAIEAMVKASISP
ncbi:MAG TPA: glycerol kinase, partial [Eubacterium sp.]|nr:glycerol kinase [Eubacterium sp.]